jgi:OFA family oxalate/formate antiporter-like MFS transporter
MMTEVVNRGWRVTLAGMGINLALGILYSWSVISKRIPEAWGWSEADKAWPYSVACLVFSLMMIPAGRLQDRFGPRWVATMGGLLVGLGMAVCGVSVTPGGYAAGFGILAGAGIGCGYASTTPPAVKWFPASRTGLIAGIVVAGFGLSSVYAAPLTDALITTRGISAAVTWLGIGFLGTVTLLSQFLQAPPPGWTPAAPGSARALPPRPDFTPGRVLRSGQFYLLWFMYACGAGAGLMIISKLAKMAEVQAGVKLGFLLVAIMAVGNGAGRVVAGMVSDRIGRTTTLFICFIFQAASILLLAQASADNIWGQPTFMAVLSAFIGANYGANLALFPAITKDFYGLKNFGVNYGLVFTAWGLGGFSLSLLAGAVYDATRSFTFAYYCSAGLLLAAAAVTFMLAPPWRNDPVTRGE